MDALNPGLAGHKGLRGEILLKLKKAQPLTAKELADDFLVSANAIRRHLLELEAEGVVEHEREQRGAGAPTHAYRLSGQGEELFPKRYEAALRRLLDYVVAEQGRSVAVSVLAGQYEELRRQLGGTLGALAPVDRLGAVAAVMRDAGFMAEVEEVDGECRLTIHNCAMHAAAECVPEVCDSELDFLESMVKAPLERGAHIMDGCNACQYAFRSEPAAPAALDEPLTNGSA